METVGALIPSASDEDSEGTPRHSATRDDTNVAVSAPVSAPRSVDVASTTTLLARYPLRYLGDELLRTRCDPVSEAFLGTAAFVELCAALNAQRAHELGIGLAANQIGHSLRLFVVGRSDGAHFFVNPTFTGEYGPAKKWAGEGSLSIPGFRTSTVRHEWVGLTWTDEVTRERTREVFRGRHAQVVEHLMDQLNGTLIVDGVSRQQRREAHRLTEAHLAKRLWRHA